MPVAGDQEIAAQLEGVFAIGDSSDSPATKNQTEVLPNNRWPENAAPSGPAEPDSVVSLAVRVTEDRKWPRLTFEVRGKNVWPAHRHRNHVDADGTE